MYSKKTPNLGLPQWGMKDHPDFLTDINEAFETIDSKVGTVPGTISKVVAQLDTLTDAYQSLREDTTELQSEYQAQNIKLINMKAETDKIPGVVKTNAGLQQLYGEIDAETDAIRKFLTRNKIYNSGLGDGPELIYTNSDGDVLVLDRIGVYGAIFRMHIYPRSIVDDSKNAYRWTLTTEQAIELFEKVNIDYNSIAKFEAITSQVLYATITAEDGTRYVEDRFRIAFEIVDGNISFVAIRYSSGAATPLYSRDECIVYYVPKMEVENEQQG